MDGAEFGLVGFDLVDLDFESGYLEDGLSVVLGDLKLEDFP